MGRIFQTSTPRPRAVQNQNNSQTLHQMKMKAKSGPCDKLRDRAIYQSFYNVQKTRISARYPFLPSNQIEKRIKQMWENASAEKRATFCSSLPGTTSVKSPFRGTILKGLLKRAGCSGFQADRLRPECSVPVFASPPSIRLPGKATHGILRSSEKKRTSTPRVSFRLDGDSLPSPIPVYSQAKRSLASTYLKSSEASGTTEPADCSKGNQAIQQHVGANGTSSDWNQTDLRQILPAETDASSTADVNIVNGALNDDGGKNGNKGNEDCKEIIIDDIRQCPGEKDTGTPISQAPLKNVLITPIRQSLRSAAIAAKAKIRSPKITQMKENNDIKKRKQTKITQYSPRVAITHLLKKTELSWEEKQMYEFQDDENPEKSITDTGNDVLLDGKDTLTRKKFPRSQVPVENNPEEYNLDSNVNEFVFSQDGQSSSQTGNLQLKKSKKKRHSVSEGGSLSGKKRGRSRKEAKAAKNLSQELEPPKKRGRPKKNTASVTPSEKKKGQPTASNRNRSTEITVEEKGMPASQRKEDIEKSDDLVIAENKEHVSWMVSAHPSSSSDEANEVDDDHADDDDSDVALYQHYHMDSQESSSPTSATQESSAPTSATWESVGDVSSQKVCEGFEAFCSNILSSREKTPSPSLESLLSVSPASSTFIPSSTSEATPEVPLVQEDFMLCPGLIPNRVSAPTNCPGSVRNLQLDRPIMSSPLSRKQKMRLQNGDCSESSQSSDAEDCIKATKEDGTSLKPDRWNTSKKKKQTRGASTKQDPLSKSPLYAGDVNKPQRTRGRRMARGNDTAPDVAAPRWETSEQIKSKLYRQREAESNRKEMVEDKCLNVADVHREGSQILVGWNHPIGLPNLGETEDSSPCSIWQSSRGQTENLTRSILSELKSDSEMNKVCSDKNLCRGAENHLQFTKETSRCCPVNSEKSQKYDCHGGMPQPDLLVGRDLPSGLKVEEEEIKDVEDRTMEWQDLSPQEDNNGYLAEKENCMFEEGKPTGDGILCELFPPCKGPVRRLDTPSNKQWSPPTDPVSAHLFLEENLFF